jgi:hypothetical protein
MWARIPRVRRDDPPGGGARPRLALRGSHVRGRECASTRRRGDRPAPERGLRQGRPRPGFRRVGAPGEFFTGGLDDLRLYAEALSPAQLARLSRRAPQRLPRSAEMLPDEWKPRCAARHVRDAVMEGRKALHSGKPARRTGTSWRTQSARLPNECAT